MIKVKFKRGNPKFPILLPDAYKICRFCKVIWIFEIEDTNKLSRGKLVDYSYLWWDLDSMMELEINFICYDRYGLEYKLLPPEMLMETGVLNSIEAFKLKTK